MTEKQDSLYWREWGKVTRACKRDGVPAPDRHALHGQALGQDKSHAKFTNADFDKVLAVFRAWSQPGDIRAQMRQEEQPLIRLRHRIGELSQGNEGLVAKLLHDRFKWPVWLRKHHPAEAGLRVDQCPALIVAEYHDSGLRVEVADLNETELTQLRDTLCRIKPTKAEPVAGEDEPVLAGAEGRPF